MCSPPNSFMISVPLAAADEDTIAGIALEAGADDFSKTEDSWEITCEPNAFEPIRAALVKANIETLSAELAMVPASSITIDAETGKKVLQLTEILEDHDDVQNVYANFDISDGTMTRSTALT